MDIRDIVTLDNGNTYIICSKVIYENKNYYYLVNINNSENLMFCYEDKNELVELNNKELVTKLIPLFYNASKNLLPNE